MKINKRNIGAILLIAVLTIGIVATGSQTKQKQESQNCYFLIEYHTDPNYKSAKIDVPCDSFHNMTAASDSSERTVWTVTPR